MGENLKQAAKYEQAEETNARRSRFVTGTDLGITFKRVRLDLGETDSGDESSRLIDEALQQEVLQWLRSVQALRDMDDTLLLQLLAKMEVGDIGSSKEIIHVGEIGDAMYFLESGSAEALVKDVSVKTYDRGGFFGEMALITDERRKATVRASQSAAKVWRLNKTDFQTTLNLDSHVVKVLNFADRSPIAVQQHAKVARAFGIFLKLGMRHMCVVNEDNRLVGILTRKDMMTYKISENLMKPDIEAMIRAFVYRWRMKRATAPPTPTKDKKTHNSTRKSVEIQAAQAFRSAGEAFAVRERSPSHEAVPPEGVRHRSVSLESANKNDLAEENKQLKKTLEELQKQLPPENPSTEAEGAD